MEISQNFVAFSEYRNFYYLVQSLIDVNDVIIVETRYFSFSYNNHFSQRQRKVKKNLGGEQYVIDLSPSASILFSNFSCIFLNPNNCFQFFLIYYIWETSGNK